MIDRFIAWWYRKPPAQTSVTLILADGRKVKLTSMPVRIIASTEYQVETHMDRPIVPVEPAKEAPSTVEPPQPPKAHKTKAASNGRVKERGVV